MAWQMNKKKVLGSVDMRICANLLKLRVDTSNVEAAQQQSRGLW